MCVLLKVCYRSRHHGTLSPDPRVLQPGSTQSNPPHRGHQSPEFPHEHQGLCQVLWERSNLSYWEMPHQGNKKCSGLQCPSLDNIVQYLNIAMSQGSWLTSHWNVLIVVCRLKDFTNCSLIEVGNYDSINNFWNIFGTFHRVHTASSNVTNSHHTDWLNASL